MIGPPGDSAHGAIAGERAMDRARAVSGVLAELGITELRLRDPPRPARSLEARRTDLPTLLVGAPSHGVRIECQPLGIVIWSSPGAIRWSAPAGSGAALALRAVSAST